MNQYPKFKTKWVATISLLFLIFLLAQVTFYPQIEAVEKEKITYIALGDSLTAGIGSSETNYLRLNAFVPQLTSYLRKNDSVYVENHGIPGMTSEQLVFYLSQGPGISTTLRDAQIITITIGGNDLLQLLRTESLTSDDIQRTILQIGQRVERAILEVRQHNEQASIHILGLYLPYDQDHPLHDLGKEAIPAYNHELQKRVSSYSFTHFVPIYNSFVGRQKELTHISNQDIHPNDQGYQAIFEAFKNSLQVHQP